MSDTSSTTFSEADVQRIAQQAVERALAAAPKPSAQETAAINMRRFLMNDNQRTGARSTPSFAPNKKVTSPWAPTKHTFLRLGRQNSGAGPCLKCGKFVECCGVCSQTPVSYKTMPADLLVSLQPAEQSQSTSWVYSSHSFEKTKNEAGETEFKNDGKCLNCGLHIDDIAACSAA